MEVKELRIGNYVINQTGEMKDIPSSDPIQIDLDGLSWASLYLPIPLTEGWLVKFGWSYYNKCTTGNLTMDFGGKIDVDFIDGKLKIKSHYEGGDFYRELNNIKYVHQLQNLYFTLTNKELTIDK